MKYIRPIKITLGTTLKKIFGGGGETREAYDNLSGGRITEVTSGFYVY